MSSSLFVCQQCGNEFTKWFGKCPVCGEWGSLVETAKLQKAKGAKKTKSSNKAVKLGEYKPNKVDRISTNMEELDRALGGGIVEGQVILIAGEPGVGKSTLLLELSENIKNVLYSSGEESLGQVAIRAQRLGVKSKKISFLETTDIDNVIEEAQKDDYQVLIVDSIQTMATTDLSGMAGSVGQVKECAYRLVKLAKSRKIAVFIVGHVTKQGSVAGPSVLMHIVDTVLWFEGENTSSLRLLRAVKNRFGPTDEVGVFSMNEKGLESESNPEKLFLSKTKTPQPGSAISVTLQGTRPLLVEVQALVVRTKTAYPRRVAQGISSNRLELLLAVLIKRLSIPLYDFDCYVNISGGMSVKDPAIDMAICLAISSSYFAKPLPKGLVSFGEVGLLGDIRSVSMEEKRAKSARRIGYKNIASSKIYPYLNQFVSKFFKQG